MSWLQGDPQTGQPQHVPAAESQPRPLSWYAAGDNLLYERKGKSFLVETNKEAFVLEGELLCAGYKIFHFVSI